ACERATTNDFHKLEEALEAIEATVADPIAGSIADYRFHEALVLASHSQSLGGLYSAIEELTIRSHNERRKDILTLEGIEDYLIEHHRKVLQALATRDQAQCSQLLVEHFSIGRELHDRAQKYPKFIKG